MIKCVCGKLNDDGMRFCEECGRELSISTTSSSSFESVGSKFKDFTAKMPSGDFVNGIFNSFSKGREETEKYATKEKTLVPDKLKLCDGEIPIKQYHCATEESKLLGLSVKSFIQVTNKRIIYCRMGTSFLGPKVYQAEAPLSDVSSVLFARGFKVNLLSLILSIIAYGFITGIAVLLSKWGETFGIISLVLGILGLGAYFGLKFFYGKKDLGISLYGISALLATAGLGTLVAGIVAPLFLIAGAPILLKMITTKYFGLSIGSKSASNYPINAGGIEAFGMTGDVLDGFISAVPSDNIDVVERELNAMILDIQQLGDYGIEKWKEK